MAATSLFFLPCLNNVGDSEDSLTRKAWNHLMGETFGDDDLAEGFGGADPRFFLKCNDTLLGMSCRYLGSLDNYHPNISRL